MKLLTITQMREIEKEADSKGLSYAQMMQNAGRGLAEIVHAIGQENGWDSVTGLVGSGNNGGDTLVALGWLALAGWQTRAYLAGQRPKDDPLIPHFLETGGELAHLADDDKTFETLHGFLAESDVFLDGLLGTGIKLPLKKEAARVLENTLRIASELDPPPLIVAVDCPSGVDCDTGAAADETIPADLTVCMAAVKQGLLKLPAFELTGALEVANIGLPPDLDSWSAIKTDVADWDMVSALLPERTPASHKGTFGTVMLAAGSTSYTGAALLAGKAAYRIGAGLVAMAVPEPLHAALAGHIPEATWLPLPHENGFISQNAAEVLLNNLERATAILLGPGLGDKPSTGKFVAELLPSIKIPLVIDADGLRHLARTPLPPGEGPGMGVVSPLPPGEGLGVRVYTPHPGEMSAMTGLSIAEIQANREKIARKYAQEWGQVVVLKGAFTVIASPDGRSTIIPVATPALARAGTGDVLAGLIVGLLAQGVSAYDAAVAGAFIHAQAGLRAAETLGTTASVLASDVLNAVPDILAELE